MIDMQAGRS